MLGKEGLSRAGAMADDGPSWRTHLPPHIEASLLRFYSEQELASICQALARPPLVTRFLPRCPVVSVSCRPGQLSTDLIPCDSVRVNTVKTTREELMGQLKLELRALGANATAGPTGGWSGNETPYGVVEAHPDIPDCILIRPQNKSAHAVQCAGRELLVSRRCAEAVLRGAHIYIPGMMGCSPHCAQGDLVTVLCDVHDRFLRGSSTHILSTRKLDPKRMKGCAMKKMGLDELSVRNKKKSADSVGAGSSVAEQPCGGSEEERARVLAMRSQFRADIERLDHKFGDLRHECYSEEPDLPPALPDGIVVLGKGVMEVDKKEAFTSNQGVGCRMVECVYTAPPLNGLLPTLMYIQNLPSMVVPHVLDPQQGDRVLDMCASPGGKSTHVAALMKGTGTVVSLDRTEAKVAIIRQWAIDLGLPNVECHKADSTLLVPYVEETPAEQAGENSASVDTGKSKRKKKGATSDDGSNGVTKEPFRLEPESFDRIVLDPPCTALGLRPRLSIDLPATEMERTPGYQRRMLHVAATLLKPGGRLVYSTCTMNPEENECNVAYALRVLPLQLIPAEPRIAPGGRGGCGLTEEQCAMVQRFEPGGQLDSNGFFVAAFQKECT